MRSIKINNENEKYIGKNIYKALGIMFPALSVGNLNKVFRLKDVKVNGTRVSKEYVLKGNDLIEIYLQDNILFGIDLTLNYIYEDENIIAVYKNTNIESCNESHIYINSQNIYLEDLVKKDKGNNINICHRLDTNTEGIVIFSRNEEAHKELLNAFKQHNITKKYLAFVYSKSPKSHDILNAYLEKNDSKGIVTIYDKPNKNSVKITTEYNKLNYFEDQNVTLLEIILHTGKTHQIRAHMKHIGTPVIGDPKYCTKEINRKYNLKRQALYAYNYTFNFDKNSPLEYLNNVEITLDTNQIISKVFNIKNQ